MFKQNADGAVDCLILTSSVSRQQAAAKVECPLIGCPLRTPPTDWWNKLILLDGIPIDVTLIRSLYLVSPAPNTAHTQPTHSPHTSPASAGITHQIDLPNIPVQQQAANSVVFVKDISARRRLGFQSDCNRAVADIHTILATQLSVCIKTMWFANAASTHAGNNH